MVYEDIRLLKKSEKSTVHLVRMADGGEQIYVRKRLKGRHPIYQVLKDCPHPCLPKLHEVILEEDSTTVVEEYIEGRIPVGAELSHKQLRSIIRQLCGVLEFLHGKGIIHRDIKPSNLLLTGDGRLYLIDFDAARMPKEDQEQDTHLLGTRGFAPPEQYGFAQTDERTDIYALGTTLECILGDKAGVSDKKVIRRCKNLDPDKRYQSVRDVRRALFRTGRKALCIAGVALLLAGICVLTLAFRGQEAEPGDEVQNQELTVLPAPGNPHWDGETGIALWENVPEAGVGDELHYMLRLYRRDTQEPPTPEEEGWYFECLVRVGRNVVDQQSLEFMEWNLARKLDGNGTYYFTIAAVGDGIQYADSPYAVSDAFSFTGEDASPLPAPTGLAWKLYERNGVKMHIAVWDNLDDYEDKDSFNVTVYDKTGAYVTNNVWPKSSIEEVGYGGIPIQTEYLAVGPDCAYRFTVQVYSSRPNEYGDSPMPDPAPEEYYSPWTLMGLQSDSMDTEE